MGRIAGLIPKYNTGTPKLDSATIKHLLGAKKFVQDGFFFLEKVNIQS